MIMILESLDIKEDYIKIIEIVLLILCLFGMIGNCLSISVCLRKRLKSIPTFVFMCFMTIMDTIPLIAIALYPFILEFLKLKSIKLSFEFCKLIMFLTFWSLQSSAYLLVKFLKVKT